MNRACITTGHVLDMRVQRAVGHTAVVRAPLCYALLLLAACCSLFVVRCFDDYCVACSLCAFAYHALVVLKLGMYGQKFVELLLIVTVDGRSFAGSSVGSLVRWFVGSIVCSFVGSSFVRSLVRSLVRSFVDSFLSTAVSKIRFAVILFHFPVL